MVNMGGFDAGAQLGVVHALPVDAPSPRPARAVKFKTEDETYRRLLEYADRADPQRSSCRGTHCVDTGNTVGFGTNSPTSSRNGDSMGVMARKSGENVIITSDRVSGEQPSNRAPKQRGPELHQVWTGDQWSANAADAKTFPAIDVADDYIRENYVRVMGPMAKR
jgi:hypothetical protein